MSGSSSAPSWIQTEEDGDLYAQALAQGADSVVLTTKRRVEKFIETKVAATGKQ
jgi:hypothetical protein